MTVTQTLDVVTLTEWKSPVSHLPEETIGTARIKNHHYPGGRYYNAWGQRGVTYIHVPEGHRLDIKNLQLMNNVRWGSWETWMVDDPPHLWAMEDYAAHSTGKVLVAGLGLGLVIHALAHNKLVTSLTVIEKNPDVISLVGKHLPKDRRRTIIVADFWDFIQTDKTLYDRIIVDIYTTGGNRRWRKLLFEDILPGYTRLRRKYGDNVSIIIHGFGTLPQQAYDISQFTGHDIEAIAWRLIPENLRQ